MIIKQAKKGLKTAPIFEKNRKKYKNSEPR